jgi:hypothetical protein
MAIDLSPYKKSDGLVGEGVADEKINRQYHCEEEIRFNVLDILLLTT